jgi:hypothetical protein
MMLPRHPFSPSGPLYVGEQTQIVQREPSFSNIPSLARKEEARIVLGSPGRAH